MHYALKQHIAQCVDGDTEVYVGNYRVDVVSDVFYEVQTAKFSALTPKVYELAEQRPVVIVHPVSTRLILVRNTTRTYSRPLLNVFKELVHAPTLIEHPQVSLWVMGVTERRIQTYGKKRRRYGWKNEERVLENVTDGWQWSTLADTRAHLDSLPASFTTADIKRCARVNIHLARKIAYTLRKAGHIVKTGTRKRAYLYEWVESE